MFGKKLVLKVGDQNYAIWDFQWIFGFTTTTFALKKGFSLTNAFFGNYIRFKFPKNVFGTL